jgi:hypothetical protein
MLVNLQGNSLPMDGLSMVRESERVHGMSGVVCLWFGRFAKELDDVHTLLPLHQPVTVSSMKR